MRKILLGLCAIGLIGLSGCGDEQGSPPTGVLSASPITNADIDGDGFDELFLVDADADGVADRIIVDLGTGGGTSHNFDPEASPVRVSGRDLIAIKTRTAGMLSISAPGGADLDRDGDVDLFAVDTVGDGFTDHVFWDTNEPSGLLLDLQSGDTIPAVYDDETSSIMVPRIDRSILD